MKLIICSLFLLINYSLCARTFTREFQVQLDLDYFEDSREDGFDFYINLWEEGAEYDISDFVATKDIREEFLITSLDTCGSNDFLRERVYIDGDRQGLVTVGMKSSGSLTESEALDEDFSPSSQYENDATEYIEYDIHTCEADYAANTRIDLNERININTCDDVNDIFPDAVSGSNDGLTKNGPSTVYTALWTGQYLGGKLTIDITLNYDSVTDAENDNDISGGELSFTMFAADGDEFSAEQTEWGIRIYNHILEAVGSSGEEYPCEDGTTVADFFINDDGNNNDYDSSNSAVMVTTSVILTASLILMFI